LSPSRDRSPGSTYVLLALVVLAALAVRLWGLSQGGPMLNGRPDEREMLINTGLFSTGDFNPRWNIYPNLFCWLYWLWIEIVLGVMRLWTPLPDYATLLANDLPWMLYVGRGLSAVAGAATVAVIYFVGREAGGRRVGMVAAVLLAANFLHVRDSHSLKTESLLALGVLVSIWTIARWAERRTTRSAVVAGVAVGVATGFKYNAILLLVAAWVADLLSSPRAGVRRLWPSAQLIGVGAVAVATFLACSPYLLLDWPRTEETLAFMPKAVFASRAAPPMRPQTLVETVRTELEMRAFVYHVTVSLRRGAGLLFALLTPLGVLFAFRRPRTPLLVLAATFALFYYGVIGISQIHLSRYLTPIVPLLILLVAALLGRLVRRDALLAVVTLALVVEPLYCIVQYDRLAARTDTRVLATQWMTEHMPPGTVVAQLGTLVFGLADPELPPGVKPAPIKLGDTDFDRHGVRYVVTHEHALPFSRLIPGQMDALRPRLKLLATFTPYTDGPGGRFEDEDAYYIPLWDFAPIERPGPLVHIYAWEPAT
jgi:4-amino-4-deoxy-L-arabinose transferase-like glycosyltransferase